MQPELSRLVSFSSLPKGESLFEIETSAEERAAIAKRLDLIELNSLSASLRLVVDNDRGGVDVAGRFAAETVQPCAVTTEPLVCKVAGALAVCYAFDAEADTPVEIDAEDESDDVPAEPIVDGGFDLGEALTQALSLEIDPYPRAPGLSFDIHIGGAAAEQGANTDAAAEAGPFAGLAALKNKLEENR